MVKRKDFSPADIRRTKIQSIESAIAKADGAPCSNVTFGSNVTRTKIQSIESVIAKADGARHGGSMFECDVWRRTTRSKAVPSQSSDFPGGPPCLPRICRLSVPFLRTSGTQWIQRIRPTALYCGRSMRSWLAQIAY